jgi:hypothetical protein
MTKAVPDTLSPAEHATAAAIFAVFDLAAANVSPPNWDQFLTDSYAGCLAVATGTPTERLIEVSRRMDQYPSFVTAAQRENLALLQVVIARAHADYLVDPSTGISPTMEAAIRAAMVANHLVLP